MVSDPNPGGGLNSDAALDPADLLVACAGGAGALLPSHGVEPTPKSI